MNPKVRRGRDTEKLSTGANNKLATKEGQNRTTED